MVAEHLEALRAALADRYVLERELGQGGMATVFLAQDRKHRRAVALKVLRPDVATAVGYERFLQEIKTAAGLAHPHIVPVYDSGEAGGFLYYVMPYIAGETLRDRLAREGQLPLDDALRITGDVADALGYAHSHGIVHRDIKPANILLSGGHAVVADFGIAQAISAARAAEAEHDAEAGAAFPREDGVTVGTPAYMSPEQALGSSRLDGRSDLYSLGCVLYEVLAGRPPFRGSSAAELGAQHFADLPTPIGATGRTIPLELETVVRRALAKMPADRFQTALQLTEALPPPAGTRTSGGAAAAKSAVPGRRWPRLAWPLLAAAVALALAGGAFLTGRRFRPDPGLDAGLYVLLPFSHRGGAAPELLSADNCESLLYEGIARWTDVRLVNMLRVHDAKARHGNAPVDFEGGMDIARELGAGKMIWGEVWEFRDTLRVHAAVYDIARHGAVVREQTVKLAKSDSTIGLAFNALADSLLLGDDRAPLAVAGARGTDLLAAWRAYSDGHAGLARWDLTAAEAGFRRAVDLDPGFPHAHLWLAQVLDWESRPAEEWGAQAGAALQTAQRLDPRNAAVARGLAAMAGGRYPQACGEFDALIEHDSLDFTAWYGRGECLARDHLVVRDARSASGWRFRASYAAAIDAYTHALRILPSVHRAFRGEAYQRLAALLYTQPNQIRLGYGLGAAGDTLRFAARLALAADTIAFVPYAQNDLLLGRHPETLATLPAAVARTRELQGRIAREWLRVFPGDADAVEAAAAALEQQGLLRARQRGEASALDLYARAAAISGDAGQRLRLAAARVRVLVRLQEFEPARALADSVLASTDSLQPQAATYLAGLAALTGRTYRAAALLRRAAPGFEGYAPDGSPLRVPPAVAEEALGLLGFASIGAPEDSVRAIGRRVLRLVDVAVEPDDRARVRYAALNAPFALAFPLLGRSVLYDSATPNYLLRLQAAALRHDADLGRMLAALDAEQAGVRTGDIAVDNGIAQATLSLMIADTARAAAMLDATLAAVPTLSIDFLGADPVGSVPQVGGLVRAMALRARLAALEHDPATAQRWAHAVRILWVNADLPLQSILGQMQVLDRAPAGSRS